MLTATTRHLGHAPAADTCFRSGAILALLIGIIATLLTLSTAGQIAKYVLNHDEVFGLVRLTYVSTEGNLPTFYSALALLTCAALLALCGQLARSHRERFQRQWFSLSLIFLYLAVDEASMIHELTGKAIKRVVPFDGFLFYPWVLVGFTAVAIAAISYFRFVRNLPWPIQRLVMSAAAVFVGGALGVEMFGGRHAELYGAQNLEYSLIATLEEGCEMLGIALFMYALIRYLERKAAAFVVRFGPESSPAFSIAPELSTGGDSLRPLTLDPAFRPILTFSSSEPAALTAPSTHPLPAWPGRRRETNGYRWPEFG